MRPTSGLCSGGEGRSSARRGLPGPRGGQGGSIFEYIEVFYNRKRRHSTLGYVRPAEYEQPACPLTPCPLFLGNSNRGLLSFDRDGSVLLSPALPMQKLALLGVRDDAKLSARVPGQEPFLAYHRDRVFIRQDAEA